MPPLSQRILTVMVITLLTTVTGLGAFKVLMDQVFAIIPANNIQLIDQSGPGNQQPGYTNGNTIVVQFDHDNTADAFFLDENPIDPPCGIMIALNNPNTPATQNVPAHNLTPGDGTKNVFVHLVDFAGDGCGGNPDEFSTFSAQIILDTQVPADPIAADFDYTIADSGSLANAIVDGGSGIDFQIVTGVPACNTLANAWNSAFDAGTGFGADASGLASSPAFVAGAGANVGENVCIRVRDKAGNVSNIVADGQIAAAPASGGSSMARRLILEQQQLEAESSQQETSNSDKPSTTSSQVGAGGTISADSKTEDQKIVDSVNLLIPEDVFGQANEHFILDLYFKGILDFSKISFEPNNLLNRAEMLKIVILAFPGENSPRKSSPFRDIVGTEWHARYFVDGHFRKIVEGYQDRTARPQQNVTRVEALAMLSRAAQVNLDYYRNQELNFVDIDANGWYVSVLKWAVFEGIIDSSTNFLAPNEFITRAEMAQLTSTTQSSTEDEPCNCDKEKAAWEAAEAEAKNAQEAAEAAQADADSAAAAGADADKAAKDAQKKVADLAKFFDTSSSATSNGETVTTGDLELLREANKGVYDAWKAGTITAQEASDAWGKISKEELAELRAKKAAELEQAKKDAADAKAKADAAKKAAEEAAAKAAAAKAKAAEARAQADAAKNAYDECLKKCELLKAELAAQRAQEEADRAAAEAEKKRQAEEEARRAAEAAARAAQEAENARKNPGGGGSGNSVGGGSGDTVAPPGDGGGGAESVSEGPCQKKFTTAIKARAAQVEARGGAGEKLPGETVVNVATTVLDALGGAAGAIAEGGSNAAAGLAAGASLVFAAYGLWVDYVGSTILAAGKSIVAKRICQVVSATTNDGCGHVSASGQTVYYEKGPDGKLRVLIMGPGDTLEKATCD